ncbi:putative late blight resistance protein R1A-10 [Capsicum annuum]
MAAYAAVTSLMGTIHLVSQSNMDLLEDHKEQLKLLYEKVGSLLEFLDDETMIDLRKEIKNVAEKVEDEVESYIQREAQRTLLKILRRVLHLPTKDNGKLFRFCQRVIEDVDSIKENQQKKKNNNSQIRNNPSLMYYDPSIVSFFDIRGWITASKDYNYRNILACLLQDAIGVKEKLDKFSDEDLEDHLQKGLKARRYLIVAEYASFPNVPFPMRFLEQEESWNLFRPKAFDKKVCPMKFDNVAKEVVKNCKELPLVISTVAGTLSGKRTLDEWWKVAQTVSSLVNLDDYQRCSGVLVLSYNHLPPHLKSCFLYFGVFPKAREISVKKLLRLWTAEGLLELKGLEEPEKLGSSLLQDLIDKSLVVVGEQSLDGKIKAYRIHDLLHDLCLGEAESENLLYVLNPPVSKGHQTVFPKGSRWVSLHSTRGYFSSIRFDDLMRSKTRSLHISFSISIDRLVLRLNHFKFLRVLDLEKVSCYDLPREIVQLSSLRYFSMMVCKITKDLSISKLWNLQTLVFRQSYRGASPPIILSNGIWEMSQLRHLQGMYLCSPPQLSANEVKYRALENLQSVSGLSSRCCTKEIFEGIKKVKKVQIFDMVHEICSKLKCLDNLICLHELEELSIEGYIYSFIRLPRLEFFPPNLTKLTVNNTRLPWKEMTIISKLPKLKVLQLKKYAFDMKIVWELTEMGFPELRFLLLEESTLVYWRAADDYFPCLERVVIRNCRYLHEIPQGFADSMTLQQIELHGCRPSLVTFVDRIQKEQLESSGSDMRKVYAFDTIREFDEDHGEVMKTVEEDSNEDLQNFI